MRFNRTRALVVCGAALVLGVLGSCSSATDEAPAPATSSTVYAFTQTPGEDIWPNLKIGVNPVSGKTISHLTFTYAVNANMLLTDAGFGYNLEYNDLWSPNQTAPTQSKTWTTTVDVANLTWGGDSSAYAGVADETINFKAWYSDTNACTIYLKQINVTYGDSSTEVFTFTTTSATPVHIVATSGTTDVAFSDRLWFDDWAGATDMSSGLTHGVQTVAF